MSDTRNDKSNGMSVETGRSISSMAAMSKVTPSGNDGTMAIGNVNAEPKSATPTPTAEPERLTMPTGRKKTTGQRYKADISELAKPRDPKDVAGVDIFKSPQDEILKPGGPFEKYVEEKKAEMKERMAQEETNRIIEELDNGKDYVDDAPVLEQTEDQEDYELERSNQVITNTNTMRVSAVYDDEDEEEVEEPTPVSNEPKPFFQTVGYKDDYEYPDVDISEYLKDDEQEETDMIDAETMDNAVTEAEEKATAEVEDIIEDEVYEEAAEEEEVEEEKPVAKIPPKAEPKKEEPVEEEDDIVEGSVKARHIAFTNDEETLEDLEKEANKDSDLPTEDERLEELKAEIARKVKPKAANLNLQGFTIANKSTASNKIFETKEASAGKWILPTTGICVQMREISGQKIEYLRENVSGNSPTENRNALKVIYDHIITPKPQSFEAWTKSIAFADFDHLFMPIYMAAFSDSNYMPQTCVMENGKVPKVGTGCGKMFLSDNIDIMQLVKFKDKESKKKFWNLYNSDRTNSEGLYVSEVVPVSNKFAIEFCEPTLYSVLFENGTFGREFNEKYENVISFMPYISRIFWIDARRKTLVPVSYKKYDNNASKTAKSKVIRYSNVLDSLSTDEYTAVVAIISSINEKNDWFTYRIPEMTCPECGRTIPEEESSAAQLVFTRHRLGVLANTSIN